MSERTALLFSARIFSRKANGTLTLPFRPDPSFVSGFTAPWKSDPPDGNNSSSSRKPAIVTLQFRRMFGVINLKANQPGIF